ncbi:MAG: response regulator transcription factor [bacterium]
MIENLAAGEHAMDRTILVVDDDPHIREIVEYALKKAGFQVVLAEDGEQALEAFYRHSPDLVVLDIIMPEMEGTEVCKRIRSESNVPVIFLTSVDEEVDRILGLEMGGDDYVTKPFSPRELTARVKTVLKRSAAPYEPAERPAVLQHGKLRLDLDRYQVFWGVEEVSLTVTEFRILRALLSFPGKVYSRDELMDRAYPDGSVVTDRTIDTHIKRIRKKFESKGWNPVETVHGLGYRVMEE